MAFSGARTTTGRARRAGALYGALLAAASVLGLLKTLLLAKVLGADDLGLYGVVLILLPLGTYVATAGSLPALGVQLPLAFGAGSRDAPALRDRSLGLILCTATVAIATYLLVVAALSTAGGGMRTALMLAAGTVALNAVFEFYLTVLRATVRLVSLAGAYFARSALALAATVAGGAAFGYAGAIVAEIAAFAVTIAVIARYVEPSTRPRRFVARDAARLIRTGIPLSASTFLLAVAVFADRWFVAATMPDELGQYTFASVVTVAWLAATGFVAQAVGSSALHAFGSGVPLQEVRRRLARATAGVLGIGLIGLPVVLVVTDVADERLFHGYGPGLSIMPILYLGGALSAVSIYGFLLLAAERFARVATASLAGAVTALGSSLAVAVAGASLEGFAWCFVGGQAAFAAATVAIAEVTYSRARACAS